MITEGYVCGIDVGAARLDVALYCDKKFSRAWVVENNEAGITDLVRELCQVQPKLVVIEATGGYEKEVTYRIYEAELTAEMNRLKLSHVKVRGQIRRHIEWLTREIEDCEKEARSLVKKMPVWKANADILKSVEGVADTVAFTLLADLPELGKLTAKKINALVGVSPYNDDSGKRTGKRFCRGGRASVRTILYNATLSAIRCTGPIKNFYDKKKAEGKPSKAAVAA